MKIHSFHKIGLGGINRMPTYILTVKPTLLNDEAKDQIAKYITSIHSEVTGAPSYFAQVIINESSSRRYIGGELSDSQIWIRADIRNGRTIEQRKRLIEKIVTGVSRIAKVPKAEIWVYLNNMEATDMAEFGEILPKAGEEKEWFESLPEEVQTKLSSLEK